MTTAFPFPAHPRTPYPPLIVNAAVTGMVAQRERVPHVPLMAEQIVRSPPRGGARQRRPTVAETIVVWHLLVEPEAAAYVAASSREQARVVFEYARDVAVTPPSPDASPSATSNYEQPTAASCGSWRRAPRNCTG